MLFTGGRALALTALDAAPTGGVLVGLTTDAPRLDWRLAGSDVLLPALAAVGAVLVVVALGSGVVLLVLRLRGRAGAATG